MDTRLWTLTLALGAAVGALAILMMPKSNPTRRFMTKAAGKVEDTLCDIGDKISDEFDKL